MRMDTFKFCYVGVIGRIARDAMTASVCRLINAMGTLDVHRERTNDKMLHSHFPFLRRPRAILGPGCVTW